MAQVGEENLADSMSWEYGAEKFDKDWKVQYVLIGREHFSTSSEGKLSEKCSQVPVTKKKQHSNYVGFFFRLQTVKGLFAGFYCSGFHILHCEDFEKNKQKKNPKEVCYRVQVVHTV